MIVINMISRYLDGKKYPVLFVLFLLFPLSSAANNIENIAKRAFYDIEADPFNSSVVNNAAEKIAYAYKKEPNNPWVLIAASRLMLEAGYMKGSRSKMSSYVSKYVKEAERYAIAALTNGKNVGMTHVQFSKIQMINGDLKGAWLTLNRAHDIDSNDFYPWYYRAVISIHMKDIKRADSFLNEAETHAKLHYEKPGQRGIVSNISEFEY